MTQIVRTVYLENDRLFIIDQRLLPKEESYLELKNEEEVYQAIKTLAVRGAPAIGVTAAYGAYVSVRNYLNMKSFPEFKKKAEAILKRLGQSRPTAYNLFYALGRLREILKKSGSKEDLQRKWKKESLQIHREDLEKSENIAVFGNEIIPEKAKIITHCNAGGLATGGGGTALAVIFRAFREKKGIFVYTDETRPLLQGSRLTAWELEKTGVQYEIICDNMAASVMAVKGIDLVLVGADRIARNGDFANKIGTYSLAVLAHYHGVPFYTAAPLSTFDLSIESGLKIPIEQRDKNEVLRCGGNETAPLNAHAYNPAFDVTPHRLLTGIITEHGIIYPPFATNIPKILNR